VTVDANEDGVFDDATVVADASGDYALSLNVDPQRPLHQRGRQ
jgi:hypothetical protein